MGHIDGLFMPADAHEVFHIIAEDESLTGAEIQNTQFPFNMIGDLLNTPNRNPLTNASDINSDNRTPNDQSQSPSISVDESFLERMFSIDPFGGRAMLVEDSLYNIVSNVTIFNKQINEINHIREVSTQFAAIGGQLQSLQRQITIAANHLLSEEPPSQADQHFMNRVDFAD